MKRIVVASVATVAAAPAFAITSTDPTIVALHDAMDVAGLLELVGIAGGLMIGVALSIKAFKVARSFFR